MLAQDASTLSDPKDQPSLIPLDLDSAVVMVVMGTTGAGQSTFINFAPDQGTKEITIHKIPNMNVFLIDTPGFDDNRNEEATLLQAIADFLKPCFGPKARVDGIIFVCAITDPRFIGSSVQHLRIYEALLGGDYMSKCCLLTSTAEDQKACLMHRGADGLIGLTSSPNSWNRTEKAEYQVLDRTT